MSQCQIDSSLGSQDLSLCQMDSSLESQDLSLCQMDSSAESQKLSLCQVGARVELLYGEPCFCEESSLLQSLEQGHKAPVLGSSAAT
jgi:hypothetical protein